MDILFEKTDGIGKIVLNRPKALNALTYDMVIALQNGLHRFAHDPEVKMVLIRSNSDKAFCSGADIKLFYQQGEEYTLKTLLAEYDLNLQIYQFAKPYVAILDGIVMGGGAGISLHGSYPVATDRLKFAMPEVKIHFFPDAGASYFFSKLKFHAGAFLATTGSTIGAADAKHIGLIDHVIDHLKLEQFYSYLPDRLEEGLRECAVDVGEPMLDWDEIDREYANVFIELYDNFTAANMRDRELAKVYATDAKFYQAIAAKLVL